MERNDHFAFAMIAIVAIVAIVGLVVLVRVNTDNAALASQGYASRNAVDVLCRARCNNQFHDDLENCPGGDAYSACYQQAVADRDACYATCRGPVSSEMPAG